MPLISTLGAASSRGFGEFNQQAQGKYIEDYFSTWLYTGNGSSQTISNGIQIGAAIVQPVGFFSGTNTGLSVANNAALLVSNSEDFTMECWVNQTTVTGFQLLFGKTTSSSGDGGNFLVQSSNTGEWNVWFNGNPEILGSNTPVANVWNHVAVSRSGSTVRLFVNGTNVGSGAYSGAITNTGSFKIGTLDTSGFASPLRGYVTNFRFVKGTALYTSNFTPPTSQLTAVSGTVLLTLQSPSLFVDNSTNNFTVTNYSVTSQTISSPFVDPSITGANGLVWIKGRSGSTSHALYDTVRGATKDLRSNGNDAQTTQATGLTSFNSNGFTVSSLSSVNGNGSTYTSWTFREEPKFFDIVQYTGNGGTQTINHNLGSTPGMIIVKPVNAIGSWSVYHVSNGNLNVQFLNSTSGRINNSDYWNSQSPTSTVFYTGSQLNSNGTTYIAYLFANSAGAFGPDKNLPGIVCSSFSTNGSGGATISLGFEPQFLLVKSQVNDDGAGWRIYDTIRGMTLSGYKILYANTSDSETVTGSTSSYVAPTSTGALSVAGLSPSESYICMAVRRSPMKVPTDATTVFNPVIYTGNGAANRQVSTTSRPDVTLWASRTRTVYADNYLFDRLRGVASAASGAQGGGLQTNTTAAENANANFQISALNNNSVTFGPSSGSGGFNYSPGLDGVLWNFTRAPGFMDEVCVTAFENGTLITHNLGAVPELIFAKNRTTAGGNWMGFANIGGTAYGHALNTTSAFGNLGLTASTYIKSTTIDPIAITNAGGGGQKGSNSPTAIYLFASCPGVSKIGTYSGTGATQTISCGFTGGARYVLIKRTDNTGDWWVWDTARGMVAGTDPRLPYNSTTAEANANWVYTTTGGFQIVTTDATVNAAIGTTWTSRTSGFGTTNIEGVTYGNGLYVAVGDSGALTTSTDGITWTSRTSGFGSTNINGVTYGNGLYVAVGQSGTLRTSTDGITWTGRTSGFGSTNINAVTYGNGLYVAVGDSGALTTSTDGITWTSRTSGFGATTINAVTYGNGLYVAAGNNGILRTSTDGITWTSRTSGFGSTNIRGVTYGNGLYVAVGQSGTLTTSTDGITWTSRTSGFGSSAINCVTYGNGVYVAAGLGGTLTTSTDGTTWTSRTSGLTDSAFGVTYGDNLFVVAGGSGVMATSVAGNYIYLAIA